MTVFNFGGFDLIVVCFWFSWCGFVEVICDCFMVGLNDDCLGLIVVLLGVTCFGFVGCSLLLDWWR